MRVAFYAPLKSPTHPVPSGDRRMARLLMQALGMAGHDVALACRLRTWDDGSRPGRAERLAALGQRCAAGLLHRWGRADAAWRPDAWFTYHLYHKAPDVIGPGVSAALGIPYVVAEASFAPKRAVGPFAFGHRLAEAAIRRADAIITLASQDAAGVLPLLDDPARLVRLPPFLDTTPYVSAAAGRTSVRPALACRFDLPMGEPWLLAVGMMRAGDKQASYAVLARALERLRDRPWRLLVVGDGPAAAVVRADMDRRIGGRVRWAGALAADELAAVYAAADLMVWPAVNEAYGMALLEAQAAGCPVVAGRTGGVPDIVRDGVTGRLVPVGDDGAFGAAVAVLLDDPGKRVDCGRAAAAVTAAEHGIADAARRLDTVLMESARRWKPIC